MLKIKNLTVSSKDKKEILKDLNLEINENEVHVIMGQNGTGKSTLCKTILGDRINFDVKGKITYENEDITNMPVSEIAKKGIFMLFQNPLEIAGVTNAEMLRLALSERGIHKSIFEFNKELNEVLKKVGLPKEFLHRGINERMSGGERKKNEMLHLYILKPKLIILDELDSGLDIDSLKSITKNLKEYKNENNCSIIIITHHLNILEGLKPDKVHIINDGKIAVSGDYNLAKKIEKEGFSGAFNINAGEENE